MNIKLMGILIIILSGFLSSYHIKKRYNMRIKTIEELIKSLSFFHTKISFYKTPVYEIVEELSNSSHNNLKAFYKHILNSMENKDIFSSFEEALNNIDTGINDNDKNIILNFSKTLGSTDYESQLTHINAAKSMFEAELFNAINDKEKNQKSKCTLIMSGVIVIALLLI